METENMANKNIISFIGFFLSIISIQAQDNGQITEFGEPVILPTDLESAVNQQNLLKTIEFNRSIKVLPAPANKPFYNSSNANQNLVHLLTSKYYGHKNKFMLSNRLYFNGYNQQSTHLGLGSYYNLGGNLKWVLSGNISIDGGFLLSRQFGFLNSSKNNLWGTNLLVSYNITKQLQLDWWGQYATPNKDIFIDYNALFFNKKMGTSIVYKLNGRAKIGAMVEYRYSELNNEWKSESKNIITIGL